VRLGARGHRAVVASGAAGTLAIELEELAASRAVVVTDANARAFAERCVRGLALPVTLVELPPGEAHKNIASVERIWDAALDARADRNSIVVAIGGGVVGDLAGFAAATLLRGVRVVQVPTSLLAMVDSSVGGKTGFDRPHGKNLVGAFHQPSVVLCDIEALATLPRRELRAGLAEVVKTAWIEDERDVAALERDAELLLSEGEPGALARSAAVGRAVRTKARIVAIDETEQGLRRTLNLGHTFGHAIEAASGYALSHGEAVAIGLVAAARFSVELGTARPEHVERLEALLGRLGLPHAWPDLPRAEVARFLAADKKSAGEAVRFVTLGPPGTVGTLAVDRQQVLSFLEVLAVN